MSITQEEKQKLIRNGLNKIIKHIIYIAGGERTHFKCNEFYRGIDILNDFKDFSGDFNSKMTVEIYYDKIGECLNIPRARENQIRGIRLPSYLDIESKLQEHLRDKTFTISKYFEDPDAFSDENQEIAENSSSAYP